MISALNGRLRSTSQKKLLLCACLLVMMAIGWLSATSAFAYEGIYCYNISEPEHGHCVSSLVSGIRRAVGHGGGYIEVEVADQYGSSSGWCFTYYGCEAGTEYIRSGTGNGYIWNEGPGTQKVYGYLYP